ncbi:MAG TPA: selenium-binding protein SBP56-related protein, partial [Terrimicrobiaceae bacterium]|nr:selenium-binding protein SBP56-related protein [Terrimicrobiaceae bacterium]
EMLQYDVSDPFHPKKTGSVHIGGMVRQTPHPAEPDKPLRGGPQMVEVSRDGKSVYFTNSLYSAWDEQFYPAGLGSWMVKLDAPPEGGIAFDTKFFMQPDDYRIHQIRLEGGDCSTDSFCYP